MSVEQITITLPRDVLDIVYKVLKFDVMNVAFDDLDYDSALWIALENIEEGLQS